MGTTDAILRVVVGPAVAWFALAPASAPGQEREEEVTDSRPPRAETTTGPDIEGSLQLRTRWRRFGGESDADLFGLLQTDVGRTDRDPFTFHLLARGSVDLKGGTERDLFELTDTFGERWNGRVYDAHLDLHRLRGLSVLQLGRQTLVDTPEVITFDGASAQTRAFTDRAMRFTAYGGRPTHFFESSSSGDRLGGAAGELRPWRHARLRLDWLHVDDERDGADFDDDLVAASLWQRLGERAGVSAHTSWLNGEARNLRLRLDALLPGIETDVQLGYDELFETQDAQSLEFDPFFRSAFSYFPYRQVRLALTRDLGDRSTLSAGVDVRRLEDDDDEGRFNHEFERWFLEPTVRDLGTEGSELTLTFEHWDSDGDDVTTAGADARWPVTDDLEAFAGTSFALYRSDFFVDEERERVRLWYLGFEKDLREDLQLRASYEFEHSSLDDSHELEARLTWRF